VNWGNLPRLLGVAIVLVVFQPIHADGGNNDACNLADYLLNHQSEIHQRNAYSVDGSFQDYREQFGVRFVNLTNSLRAPHSWLDVGGGMALPMLQNQSDLLKKLSPEELPTNISLSIETPPLKAEAQTLRNSLPKSAVQYVARGKGLEDFSVDELEALGLQTLITDRGGGTTYTLRPKDLYQRYHQLLKPKGLLMVSVPPRTKINSGAKTFLAWLRSIKGFKLLAEEPGSYILQRTDEAFDAPELTIKSLIPGSPPTREFVW